MYVSDPFTQYTNTFVATMGADHLALLRHLTVRLHASALGKGDASVAFTGTGAIVRLEGSRSYVITAKHNLHVAGAGAKVPVEQYLATFQEKVRVELTTREGAVVWGSIDDIDLADDNIANQGYDVAVLRVDDAAFATAVRGIASPGGAVSPFAAEDWRNGGSTIFELSDAWTARSVLLNGQKLGTYPAVPTNAGYVLLQFGYGRATKTGVFGFGRRAFPVGGLKGQAFIERTHDQFQSVFVFSTDEARTTTWEGDSGGPTFAVHKNGQSSFLVGATLGANYYEGRTDDDAASPIDNNAFTVLSSDRVTRLA
jgi:hypothetical protein